MNSLFTQCTVLKLVALAAILTFGGVAPAKETLAPADGPRHYLVREGRTAAMIVLPAKPDVLEGYAALELQKYVKEITGRILPIINEPEKLEYYYHFNEPQMLEGYGIWLGQTKAADSAGFTRNEETLGRDGYAALADKNGMIIVGRNPLGTLFGVYDIIEREFGVRWFLPDDQERSVAWPERKVVWVQRKEPGTVIPAADTVSVGTFRREFKPSFDVRWIREGDWALHNRMNVWIRVNGLQVGVNCKWFVHTYTALVPPGKYFKEHPEWFALIKGKRNGYTDPAHAGHNAQLCTSNPELIEKLAERLIETIEADPTIEFVAFSPEDGRGFCVCPKCLALDGPPRDTNHYYDGITPWLHSNRFAILNNEVARRIAKRFPHVKLRVIAYSFYRLPPNIQNFRLEPNVAVQITNATPELLEQWAPLTDQLWVYETYALGGWGRHQMLRPLVHAMRDDIPLFRERGVKGFYSQSMQQPWGQVPLNHYIAAKLVWNADLDVDWLVDDYCQKFFESASDPMHEYFLELERRTKSAVKTADPEPKTAAALFDQTTRDKLRSCLNQAERLANSERVSNRVAAIRIAFEACEQTALSVRQKTTP